MADRRPGEIERGWRTLTDAGTMVGLPDAHLIGRFLDRPDAGEAAFEALVRRHGPAVLRACRAILRDPNDVDDAFQATFLALARRAGSIRDPDRLAAWLGRVARRVATRSRAESARRRRREGPVGAEPEATGGREADVARSEAREAVVAEVARLPDRLRLPVVLCDLEGVPRPEAAHRLGWPIGTLHSRLSRARRTLRDRLERRGMSPVPGLVLPAVLPDTLIESTVRAATDTPPAPGAIPMLMAPARMTAAAMLVMATALAAAALARTSPPGRSPEQIPEDVRPPAARPAADPEAGRWGTFRGRVVFDGAAPAPRVLVDPEETWLPRDRDGRVIPDTPPQRVRDHAVMAKRGGPILSERLQVDPATKGVRNAFVYLVDPSAVREAARAASPRRIGFRADGGVFVPHALAAIRGAEIVVGSDDPIPRNLRVSAPGAEFVLQAVGSRPGFDHDVPGRDGLNTIFGRAGGRQTWLTIRAGEGKVGMPVRVQDDIHTWMSAWWMVLDHPYFAVTDARGEFTIRDVPTGPQQVVVWHEALVGRVPAPRAGTVFRGEVAIRKDAPTSMDFPIEPARIAPE